MWPRLNRVQAAPPISKRSLDPQTVTALRLLGQPVPYSHYARVLKFHLQSQLSDNNFFIMTMRYAVYRC